MDTCLIYYVDKGLGIASRETSNHLDPIIIREDARYQRDAFIHEDGVADQSFPGEGVTKHNTVKLTDGRSSE